MNDKIVNADGFSGEYDLQNPQWQGGWFGKTIWDVQSNIKDPFTVCIDGIIYRIDYHIKSDLGSVPRILQEFCPMWFDRARYPKSFIAHDNIYKTGGIWVAIWGGWEFQTLTRKEADEFLFRCLLLEGASKANARTIYFGVRAGGWASWDAKKQKKERK